MAFAFYFFGVAGLIAAGGIAFADDQDPTWTTRTEVTVQVETGVVGPADQPTATIRRTGSPDSATSSKATATAGPAVVPTASSSALPQPPSKQPATAESQTTKPENSPAPRHPPTSPSETSDPTLPATDPSPTESTSYSN